MGDRGAWKERLVLEFRKRGTMTAEEIGAVVGRYGPDAITAARAAGLPLLSVGQGQRKSKRGPLPKIYALSEN